MSDPGMKTARSGTALSQPITSSRSSISCWVPMKHVVLAGILVGGTIWMILPARATDYSSPKLIAYCTEVIRSRPAVVNARNLSDRADFERSRVSEVLGQKLQEASRRSGLEGTLLLGLVVGAGGKAQDIRILDSSGHQLLDREAEEIVRGAVFSPARLNQKAVAECTHLRVTFKIG